MVLLSILILVVCALLALIVLAQNPKGGGLAAGFTGAQQIGGVQRTTDFLEKSTWTLATALMVLCLISAGVQSQDTAVVDELDAPSEQVTTGEVDPSRVAPPEEDGSSEPQEELPISPDE